MAAVSQAITPTGSLVQTRFAESSRASIELMDTLRGCGVSMDIDIPTICIIGNQSAGKSSVIEAISAVALPRASGTCTRCPSEVRLIRKDCTWRCEIFLRFEKDAAGAKLGLVKEVAFGEPIYSPADVGERVQRGQLAILQNASSDFERFLKQPIANLFNEAPNNSFSENVVCLSISGHTCVNLSFIDLPGASDDPFQDAYCHLAF